MSAPIPKYKVRGEWVDEPFITFGNAEMVLYSDYATLEAQLAEVEEYLPPESPAYQSMGERAKLLKDQMQYAAESSGELGRALADLEAQVATAIAMRDLEERNKIDFIQQLERSEAQNRQLRDALQTFVDHFGDPFKTARAALAATEPPRSRPRKPAASRARTGSANDRAR